MMVDVCIGCAFLYKVSSDFGGCIEEVGNIATRVQILSRKSNVNHSDAVLSTKVAFDAVAWDT